MHYHLSSVVFSRFVPQFKANQAITWHTRTAVLHLMGACTRLQPAPVRGCSRLPDTTSASTRSAACEERAVVLSPASHHRNELSCFAAILAQVRWQPLFSRALDLLRLACGVRCHHLSRHEHGGGSSREQVGGNARHVARQKRRASWPRHAVAPQRRAARASIARTMRAPSRHRLTRSCCSRAST